MATDNNIKHFTAADIEKYHRGLLSSKERHDLEKAALDDPFLADALEGYAVAGINSGADIAELKKKLTEKVEDAKVIPLHGGSRTTFPWLRAAAMIVFIAGAGLLVYQFAFNKKSGDTIAQAETKKTGETKTTDTTGITAPGTTGKEANTAFTKSGESKAENPVTIDVKTVTGNATKDANGAGLTRFDTSANYFTVMDKTAAPVVTTSPKGVDERNKQPAALEKNTEKKEIVREEAKNKTINNYKQEAEKDGEKDQAVRQAEDLKKNRAIVPSRKADDQYYRNNTNTFRGRVTDASNVGVPFARITNAQDNNAGTYSDAQGDFNLTSPDTVLNVQVRSVGFENNNVQLRNSVPNNQVVLQDDSKSLSEVVISDQKPNAAARSRDANMKLEEPEPADGWENYDTYLTNNLNVPDNFKPKQIKNATVEISFEVDKNGEPVNIKIEKSLCHQCDKEAIRLVKEGPKWKRKAKKGRTTVTIPFYNSL